MLRARIAIFFGTALLLACSRPAKVERHQLPGFSIELSTGTVVGPAVTPEYATGSLAIRDDDHAQISIIGWSVGSKLSRAELEPVLATLGAVTHSTDPGTMISDTGSDGGKVDVLQLDTDLAPLLLSQVDCGGRNLILATISGHDGRAFHHQLLTSLICTPDPALEKTLTSVSLELRIDLPDWRTLSHDDGQLVLTDGHSVLMLQPMPASTSDQLLDGVSPMLDAAFAHKITAGSREGDRVPLQGELDGSAVVGWAKLIPCPRSKTLVFDLSETKVLAENVATVMARATCAPAGASPQVWPDVAPAEAK